MKIIIFKKIDDLQKYCAQCFLDEIKTNKPVKLGFATGVSPVQAYQYLIKDYQKNHTSWKKVTSFNLDEFVGIDYDHQQAFIKQMKTNLFDHVNIEPSNIHIPDAQAKDPKAEALRYEKLIQENLIDFQYISLGINGHMAYNEPQTPFDSITHVANLTKETIEDLVAKQKFFSIEQCPKQAITMGIQTILKYTKKAIMVSYGINKALVTKKMLEEQPNSEITASYLQLHPNCTFVLDEQAASLLDQKTLQQAKWK